MKIYFLVFANFVIKNFPNRLKFAKTACYSKFESTTHRKFFCIATVRQRAQEFEISAPFVAISASAAILQQAMHASLKFEVKKVDEVKRIL